MASWAAQVRGAEEGPSAGSSAGAGGGGGQGGRVWPRRAQRLREQQGGQVNEYETSKGRRGSERQPRAVSVLPVGASAGP